MKMITKALLGAVSIMAVTAGVATAQDDAKWCAGT